jgi:hypothetical protein
MTASPKPTITTILIGASLHHWQAAGYFMNTPGDGAQVISFPAYTRQDAEEAMRALGRAMGETRPRFARDPKR